MPLAPQLLQAAVPFREGPDIKCAKQASTERAPSTIAGLGAPTMNRPEAHLGEHGVEDGFRGIMGFEAMPPAVRGWPGHDSQGYSEQGHQHGRDEQWQGLRAPQQGDEDQQGQQTERERINPHQARL